MTTWEKGEKVLKTNWVAKTEVLQSWKVMSQGRNPKTRLMGEEILLVLWTLILKCL